jgi:hypothetical protein
MNWKEQFEHKFSDLHHYINEASNTEGEFSVPYMKNLQDFISTEMEELIYDAVAKTAIMGPNMAREALIKKWL